MGLKQSWNKHGRVFKHIFWVLCFLMIGMLAYMSFFMNQFVLRGQLEELDRSNFHVLQQANETIERLVEDVEWQVRLALSDNQIMQHLVNPGMATVDDNMQMLRMLKNLADTNPDLAQLWLYSPISGTVLSSDGYLTALAGSEIQELMVEYRQARFPRSAPDLREIALAWQDDLYVLLDFIPAQSLGVFVFRLEAQRLAGMLAAGQGGEGTILVTDRQGRVLLPLASGEEKVELDSTVLFHTDMGMASQTGQQYYRLDSGRLGWTLLMAIPPRAGLYERASFWALTIPFLAVLLVLGAGGAYLLTRKIYTPINRLMSLVLARSGAQAAVGSDLDYLEEAYQQTLSDNEQLRGRFALMGGDLRRYLCREALQGRFHADLDGFSILGLEPGGSFQVLAVKLGASRLELADPIKRQLHLTTVKNQLAQLAACLCCLEQGGDTLLAVFYFVSGEAQTTGTQVTELLGGLAQQTDCRFFQGWGGACESLQKLREAAREAQESLQYHFYLSEDATGEGQADQEKLLERRLRQMIERSLTGAESIELTCDRLLAEVEAYAADDAERLAGYQLLENILLERLLAQDQLPRELSPVEVRSSLDAATRARFRQFCCQALELDRSYAGQKKHSYVAQGKRYMEEHFANSLLGANDISEHIGISTSYFSSIFNELTGESVTSYLNQIRVNQAKSLLTVTRIPIKEVGFRCGFNSASVFGRVFKKYTDMSPKQYRDAYQRREEGEQHA